MVANLHGRNKDIVAAGVDIAADHGSLLLVIALGPVIRRDRAGAYIRALSNLGIPDVREVGHLYSFPEGGVLYLDERAHLRMGAEDGARPEVGERPHGRLRA